MSLRAILIVLLLALVFLPGTTIAEDDPVLARAGKHEFKKSDLDRFLSYAPPLLRQQMQTNPEKLEMLIRHLMKQKIIADISRKEGFDRKKDVQEQLQYLTEDFLAREYIISAIVEKTSVSDDEVKEYYERNKEKFTTPEQVKASHILVKINLGASPEEKKKAREKAKQILEWLKKGEKFETLAEQYSEDQQSKTRGGSIGYIARGRMPKSFDEQAFSMKPGQISDVVETDYGYHIIQVEDHRDAVIKTFDEVKGSIKEQLKNELANSKVEEFTKKALKDAGLEIYTERLSGKISPSPSSH